MKPLLVCLLGSVLVLGTAAKSAQAQTTLAPAHSHIVITEGQIPDLNAEGVRNLNLYVIPKLTPQALDHLKKSLDFFNRVERDEGVKELAEVARTAPDLVDLQNIVAGWARKRAIMHTGEEAHTFYAIAREAYQRILGKEDISLEQQLDAERLLKQIQNDEEELAIKEKKMQEVGYKAIILEEAGDRKLARGGEKDEIDKQILQRRMEIDGIKSPTIPIVPIAAPAAPSAPPNPFGDTSAAGQVPSAPPVAPFVPSASANPFGTP